MAPSSHFVQVLYLFFGLAAAADYPGIPKDLTTPVQQRIAFKGPNGNHAPYLIQTVIHGATTNILIAVSVGWNTYGPLNEACVQYGKSASSLASQACSTQSVTYGTSRTWAHSVTLSGLDAATTYYYKINSTNSTVNQFVTARAAGDKASFTLAVVADVRPR
jgi:acid phosphatase